MSQKESVLTLNKENFERKILNNKGVSLLSFWATCCGPRWSGLVDASHTDVIGATGEANFTSPKTPNSRPHRHRRAWSASTDRAQSYPEAETNPCKKTNLIGKLGTWGKMGSSARFVGKVFYG